MMTRHIYFSLIQFFQKIIAMTITNINSEIDDVLFEPTTTMIMMRKTTTQMKTRDAFHLTRFFLPLVRNSKQVKWSSKESNNAKNENDKSSKKPTPSRTRR